MPGEPTGFVGRWHGGGGGSGKEGSGTMRVFCPSNWKKVACLSTRRGRLRKSRFEEIGS